MPDFTGRGAYLRGVFPHHAVFYQLAADKGVIVGMNENGCKLVADGQPGQFGGARIDPAHRVFSAPALFAGRDNHAQRRGVEQHLQITAFPTQSILHTPQGAHITQSDENDPTSAQVHAHQRGFAGQRPPFVVVQVQLQPRLPRFQRGPQRLTQQAFGRTAVRLKRGGPRSVAQGRDIRRPEQPQRRAVGVQRREIVAEDEISVHGGVEYRPQQSFVSVQIGHVQECQHASPGQPVLANRRHVRRSQKRRAVPPPQIDAGHGRGFAPRQSGAQRTIRAVESGTVRMRKA